MSGASFSKNRILVVDDHEVTRHLLQEVLVREGYSVFLAESGEKAVELIRAEQFPVILSDIRMAELDGLAVLREAKATAAGSVVILMTGFGSMEGAIKAIREGAFDYVSKPFKMDDLKNLVSRAFKHWESVHGATAVSNGKLDVSGEGLIGKSPKIVDVYRTLARAAMSSSNVLVVGERGTGKELVARAIHDNSQRRMKSFVSVSCGALGEGQLESELFGDGTGALRAAHEGTLFLDEIVDIPSSLQAKLLKALQEGEFRSQKVDIRVIAATHRSLTDLEALVKAGKFREDLYYRLKVISIELPPLRERIEDLPELVGYFLASYSEKCHKPVSHVSDEAMALLRSYSWPGNVRELEHAIERAVAMTSTTVLFAEDFPLEIPRRSAAPGARNSLEEIEKAHILKVLRETSFNKSKASEILGIDRATLYRKAQRYGIDLRGSR